MPRANRYIQPGCVYHLQRWTESIAVGRETFVREMAALTRNRRELDICAAPAGHWTVPETVEAYG